MKSLHNKFLFKMKRHVSEIYGHNDSDILLNKIIKRKKKFLDDEKIYKITSNKKLFDAFYTKLVKDAYDKICTDKSSECFYDVKKEIELSLNLMLDQYKEYSSDTYSYLNLPEQFVMHCHGEQYYDQYVDLKKFKNLYLIKKSRLIKLDKFCTNLCLLNVSK